jgi:hypothetical protein
MVKAPWEWAPEAAMEIERTVHATRSTFLLDSNLVLKSIGLGICSGGVVALQGSDAIKVLKVGRGRPNSFTSATVIHRSCQL